MSFVITAPSRSYSLFIADLHLSLSCPALTDAALAFFKTSLCRNAASLYIMGDLFDFWVGDQVALQPAWSPLFQGIAELAAACPVFVMYGNRDFMMGSLFERLAGVRLIRDDYYVFQAHHRRIVLCHGDTLCVLDPAYQRFRHVMRHYVKPLAGVIPVRMRLSIAHLLRRLSAHAYIKKPLIQQDAAVSAVWDCYRRYEVVEMIHGHTHRPAYHTYSWGGASAHRWVLPDWRVSPLGCVMGGVLYVDRYQTCFLHLSECSSD